MKDAFNKGNFLELNKLAENSNSIEALFYKAVMAENGLAQEIDIEKAKDLYKKSFNAKQLQAGINLANIYLKEGKIEDARSIFNQIINFSLTQNKFKQYASYALDSLKAKDLIQNNDSNSLEEAKKLSEQFTNYFTNLKQGTFLYFEAKYNKARLDLWIAEKEIAQERDKLEKENLNKIQEFKIENSNKAGNISGLVAKHKAELDKALEKKIQKNVRFNSAKELLQEISRKPAAKSFSYKALSLLASLEIKKNIEKKQYEEAINRCDDALLSDSTNNDIKMLKFSALSYKMDQSNVLDYEKLDQAIQLVREVRRDDPSNKKAIRREAEMQKKLVRKIGSEIVENLKAKSEYFDDKFNQAWLSLIGYKDDTKEKRESFINSLGPFITASLENADYVKNNLVFTESKNASQELSERIWPDIAAKLEKNWDNIKKSVEQNRDIESIDAIGLNSNIATQISNWNANQSKIATNNLSHDQVISCKKYNKFKEILSKRLDNYYVRCRALTDPEGDLEAKVNGHFSKIINLTSKAAPIVGAVAGDVRISAAGVVLKTFDDLSAEGKKAALYASAKEFCNISDNSAGANKKFNYIAEKIVEEYGMQIENVVLEDIEKLANVAAEKMLDKFRNASITNDLWKAFTNPGETAVNFLQSSLGVKSKIIKNPEKILLEGIRSGRTKECQEIKTEDGRVGEEQWIANEVFDKPIMTSDGENFYCKKGAERESSKYGARFVSDCSEYIKKDLSTKDCNEFAENFKKHVKLLNSAAWISSDRKQENKKNDFIINAEDLAKKERDLNLKRLVGIVVMVAGAGAMAAAGVAATAVAAGVFSVTASYGVAAGAFLGLGSFIKGFKKVSVASGSLHNLNKQKIIVSIEDAEKKAIMEERKQREKLFKEKFQDLNIETSLLSPEVKKRLQGAEKGSSLPQLPTFKKKFGEKEGSSKTNSPHGATSLKIS